MAKMSKKQKAALKKGRESPRAKALRDALIKRRRIKKRRATRETT